MSTEQKPVLDALAGIAQELAQEIPFVIAAYQERIHDASPAQKHVFAWLQEFVLGGKLLRGSLIIAVHDALQGTRRKQALRIAIAMELAHSGLLIHDDIMDRDAMRRSHPSMHKQFEAYGKKIGVRDAQHYGISMAICAADIAFLLASNILSSIELPAPLQQTLAMHFSEILSRVAFANMHDVQLGLVSTQATKEEILRVYENKTAHYTFCLPVHMGALLGDADEQTLYALLATGKELGILFQLKDDELGLLGEQEVTGKPVGADVTEHKQTLLLHELRKRISKEDNVRLQSLTDTHLTQKDLLWLQELAFSSGAITFLRTLEQECGARAKMHITTLPSSLQTLFSDVLSYSLVRKA